MLVYILKRKEFLFRFRLDIKRFSSCCNSILTAGWHHIEEEDAQIVDKLLRSNGFEFIKVDPAKLEESFESWIYVDVEEISKPIALLNILEK